MTTAKYMYRCRLCGARFYDGTESSTEKANLVLSDMIHFNKDRTNDRVLHGKDAVSGIMVASSVRHQCHGAYGVDSAYGIADFIGYTISE